MGNARALTLLVMLFAAIGCQPTVTPLARANAHNDYRHARPLLDALDSGFCSIEADIHLVGRDRLLVAHDLEEVDPRKTLQSLYLDPLRDRIRRNGGQVFRGSPGQRITLLIDLKSDGAATYAALRDALRPYGAMLTRTSVDGTVVRRQVDVVLTGNVPRAAVAREAVRHVACDGRLEDIAITPSPPVHLVPQVGARWGTLFTWTGEGMIPGAERRELKRLVARAHEQRRQTGFWAAPDHPAAWAVLRYAGVDLINSDDLPGLRRFLLSRARPARVLAVQAAP